MELRAAAQVADAVLAGPSPGDAAVLLVDGDLHVTHCAGPVQDAYGCEPGELVGRPLAALLLYMGERVSAFGV
jgi:PAS domain-containing protein